LKPLILRFILLLHQMHVKHEQSILGILQWPWVFQEKPKMSVYSSNHIQRLIAQPLTSKVLVLLLVHPTFTNALLAFIPLGPV